MCNEHLLKFSEMFYNTGEFQVNNWNAIANVSNWKAL